MKNNQNGRRAYLAKDHVIVTALLMLQPRWTQTFFTQALDINKTFVAIIDAATGREIKKFTGTNNNAFTPAFVECSEFKNKKIKIRIVDNSTKNWGHINFAGIYTSSNDCTE